MAGWFETELMDLWRLSRTALAGLQQVPSRYDRLQWTAAAMVKAHPEQGRKTVYLELDRMTRVYGA